MCHNQEKQGCLNPDKLKGSPRDCSPEQVRECHGDGADHPCVEAEDCEHPERLKDKPGKCSPEQIRECHGDSAGHPCVSKN